MRTWKGFVLASALLAGACGDTGDPTSSGGGGGSGAETGSGGGGAGPGLVSCLGTPTSDPRFAQALDVLRGVLDDFAIAGGAIAIIQDGQVLEVGAVGSKLATSCDPITVDTRFGVGFLGQLVTTIAALDAVEDGKLTLEGPITQWVPLEATNGDPSRITLHHLLTMSGMYDTASETSNDSVCTTLADYLGNAIDPVLEATPGTMQDNEDMINFEIAGLALEKVEGVPFPEVASRRVLGPLGLAGTYDPATIREGDHSLGDGGDTPIHADCENRRPSGSFHASIKDVASLAAYFVGGPGDILDPESHAWLASDRGPNMVSTCHSTYGASACTPMGEEDEAILWKTASNWGFVSVMAVYLKRRLGVVFLVNGQISQDVTVYVEAIARAYDPTIPPAWDLAYEVDPASLETLVGTYRDDLGFDGITERTMEVFIDPEDPGTLAGVLSGPEGSTTPVAFRQDSGPDNFFITPQGASTYYVRFWRDEEGQGYAFNIAGRYGPPFYRVNGP